MRPRRIEQPPMVLIVVETGLGQNTLTPEIENNKIIKYTYFYVNSEYKLKTEKIHNKLE